MNSRMRESKSLALPLGYALSFIFVSYKAIEIASVNYVVVILLDIEMWTTFDYLA